jgi:hypothetical protein
MMWNRRIEKGEDEEEVRGTWDGGGIIKEN